MPISISPKNKEISVDEKILKNRIQFTLEHPKYTFKDIILDEDTKENIENAICIYKYKDILFSKWNLGKVIKKPVNLCINFYGASGTGKTMTAHAIASDIGLDILRVNYADIESKFVGETSKNLTNLFKTAEENNAILLFDEADALLSKRVTEMTSATDVSVNQTRSVLLTLLDSYTGIIIFTTNFISNYDSAFMRRISNHILFKLPNEKLRKLLLNHYLNGVIPNNVNIDDIANHFEGITGCDIANALVNSAVKTARLKNKILKHEDFYKTMENIVEAKKENSNIKATVYEKEVSETYALERINYKEG